MQNQLLLLEDVDNLARKGEIVKVKPGYARNFLLPQKKAVVADKRAIRLQDKLKEERAKQAIIDRKDAEALSLQLQGKTFEIVVKVDSDGHMYGSVTALDISKFLQDLGYQVERREVKLLQPIKAVGVYEITLALKEQIQAKFSLDVQSDIPVLAHKKKAKKAETEEEAAPEVVDNSPEL
jgi:large subunit ribosomal protein L9